MSHATLKVTEPTPPPISPTLAVFLTMVVLTVAGVLWLAHELSNPAALPIRTHIEPVQGHDAPVDATQRVAFDPSAGLANQRDHAVAADQIGNPVGRKRRGASIGHHGSKIVHGGEGGLLGHIVPFEEASVMIGER